MNVRCVPALVWCLLASGMLLAVPASNAPSAGQPAPAASPESGPVDAAEAARLAQAVKTEFLHAWNGYTTYAWGHDDLKPISRTGYDWYGEPLLMTPVDAFTTMKLMKLDEQAAETKRLILDTLSFDKDVEVQLFEVNIRLLGGLLSAYQMDGDERFLALADDLGSRLLPAFDSSTGMPYRFVNLQTGAVRDSSNNPAEIGTLLLEWGTLSRETGNPVYYQTAKHAVEAVYGKRSKIGLVGTILNVESGDWERTESSISARIDSYYEYLLKGWLMFGDEDLHRMWETSIQAVNKYLPERVNGRLWYGRVDMTTGARTRRITGALDAFFPAVLVLAGDLERAEDLQKSFYWMWTLHGIEPEVFDYGDSSIVYDGYALRPENIESAYYLFHATGDPKYREMGRTYFDSLVRYCRNDVAYATLKSVTTKEQEDSMPSFFLAETLKYCYLLFADPGTVDFDTTIFNTEAHPLRIWKE